MKKTELPLNDPLGPSIRELIDEVLVIGPVLEDRIVGHVAADVVESERGLVHDTTDLILSTSDEN